MLGIAQVVKCLFQALRLLFNLVLLLHHLCRPFLYDSLQAVLFYVQPMQTVEEQTIDEQSNQQEVEQNHVPPHVERIGNAEAQGCHFRHFAVGLKGLNGNGVGTIRQVEELGILVILPCAPVVIVQPVAVQRPTHQRTMVEGVGKAQAAIVALQLRQLVGHFTEAAPQDAVAIQHDRAEPQAWLGVKCGVVLAHVNHRQTVVGS